jgi:hypothetical protein
LRLGRLFSFFELMVVVFRILMVKIEIMRMPWN